MNKPENIIVAALYKFAPLTQYKELQLPLLQACKKYGIKGTLLLAKEGINGTITGSRDGIDAILSYIKSLPHLEGLEHKESTASHMPFYRMKVRLKKEIVTMGIPEVDPTTIVGTYVNPKDWNELIADPEVLLIDTRNDYEVQIGTFKGGIDPKTTSFRQFPDFIRKNFDPKKHKKVAMFCTGGIRCEKASSFMLQEGFEHVYHLHGGILKYLEEIPESESLWEGDCFVFDQRVSVTHGLKEGDFDVCYGCRRPLNDEEKASEKYIEGVSCPYCYETTTEKAKKRATERHRQVLLAQERNQIHLGEG